LISTTDPNVADASKAAISKLARLGADVRETSIPFYNDGGLVRMIGIAMVCYFLTLLILRNFRSGLYYFTIPKDNLDFGC
jgi:hypothetical protein